MSVQFPDYGILYIDDEEKSLKYFSAIFEPIAPIYVAQSPEEGYEIFTEHHEHLALVLSDKKMPNESGIDLLRRIEAFDPRPFRFLVTAYADLNVAVEALNDGLLYSYLSKPWDPADLENRLGKAIKHYALSREKERLLAEKAEAFRQLSMADKAASIGILSTGLNHHLRNSLTVLRTFHDILPIQLKEELGRPPLDTSFWSDYYEEVGGQMERMTGLLSNLAEGVETGQVSDVVEINITELINDTIELASDESSDFQCKVVTGNTVPLIFADEAKIRQMLRLLFAEARELLPSANGEIEFRVEGIEGKKVEVTILTNGNLIPEKDLQHLFDPFYVRMQTPDKLGTNLLACYLTTVNHGGKIHAFHSNDGRNGIEFQLPYQPPQKSLDERAETARNLFDESMVISKACETALPG